MKEDPDQMLEILEVDRENDENGKRIIVVYNGGIFKGEDNVEGY